MAKLVENQVEIFFKHYNVLLSEHPTLFSSKDSIEKGLINTLFTPEIRDFFSKAKKLIGNTNFFQIIETYGSSSCVSLILSKLEKQNSEIWYQAYNKENKKNIQDNLSNWRIGKHSPNLKSIKEISTNPTQNAQEKEYQQIRELLFLARIKDHLQSNNEHLFKRIFLDRKILFWLEDYIYRDQKKAFKNEQNLKSYLHYQKFIKIYETEEILSEQKEPLQKQLQGMQAIFQHLPKANWCNARWHISSGNLKEAGKLFEETVEQALYSNHSDIKLMLTEALIIESKQNNQSSKRLKRYKWAMINLGFDLAELNSETSNKLEDHMQSWEIVSYATHFEAYFPKHLMFKGTRFAEQNIFDYTPQKKLSLTLKGRIKK